MNFWILALRTKFHYFWYSLYAFSKSWQLLKEQEHVIERRAPSEIDPHCQDGHTGTDTNWMQTETAWHHTHTTQIHTAHSSSSHTHNPCSVHYGSMTLKQINYNAKQSNWRSLSNENTQIPMRIIHVLEQWKGVIDLGIRDSLKDEGCNQLGDSYI